MFKSKVGEEVAGPLKKTAILNSVENSVDTKATASNENATKKKKGIVAVQAPDEDAHGSEMAMEILVDRC